MIAPSPGPSRPLVVDGRYEIVRRLGGGTQATVFHARDLRTGEDRALKVPTRGADAGLARRFVREARLAARLQPHPHVLVVHELVDVGGSPAIVSELAAGGSVAAWMHRHGPLPTGLALAVASQCADALAHAHAVGVIHRDVKPGNLLVRADGTVVLADFGVARCADDDEDDARTVGTLAFMAPEQHRGGLDGVDERADVYALGAALHRMVTGRRELALFRAVQGRPELLGDVDERVAELVRACCRHAPAERPDMVEVRARLAEALAHAPPPSGRTPALNERARAPAPLVPELDTELERLRVRVVATAPPAPRVALGEPGSAESLDPSPAARPPGLFLLPLAAVALGALIGAVVLALLAS